MKTFSLHEYRLSAPNTDSVPTITQRGLIGPILLREHRKFVRTAQRRATIERLLARLANALRRLWPPSFTSGTSARRPPAEPQVRATRLPLTQPTHL
jgi:hypothetical protein